MFSSRKAHLSCDQVLAVGGKGQSCDGLPVERKEECLKEQPIIWRYKHPMLSGEKV